MIRLLRLKLASKAKQVSFIDKTHQYYHGKQELESVTTLIKRYSKPFNAIEVAKVCSKKEGKYYGLDPVQIVSDWDKNTEESAKKGTDVHKIAELIFNGILVKDTPLSRMLTTEYLIYQDEIISCEQVIFNQRWALAGQIDLITCDGDKLILFDWKTSEEISNKAYGNMLKPFDFVPDSKYHRYSLQLSIYKAMLMKQGFKVGKLVLKHIKNDTSYDIGCVDYSDKVIETLDKEYT